MERCNPLCRFIFIFYGGVMTETIEFQKTCQSGKCKKELKSEIETL
jgi:hypothetical protein